MKSVQWTLQDSSFQLYMVAALKKLNNMNLLHIEVGTVPLQGSSSPMDKQLVQMPPLHKSTLQNNLHKSLQTTHHTHCCKSQDYKCIVYMKLLLRLNSIHYHTPDKTPHHAGQG